MEDNLLAILSKLLDEKFKPALEGHQRIEKKLDAVFDHTADLTESRTKVKDFRDEMYRQLEDTKDDLNNIEVITASNWKDIAKLKAVK